MKGKTATTGLLAMGIIIALATLGLVVGNWTQTLNLSGSVATSGLDAQFKTFTTWDYEDDNQLKPVANCSVDSTGDKGAAIVISNAYPNYWCEISGGVVNTGQMPIHIEGGDIVLKEDPSGLAPFLKIEGGCDGDKQLMPADGSTPAGSLQCTYTVSVNKTAANDPEVPEKANLTLNVEITAVQFDKSTKNGG